MRNADCALRLVDVLTAGTRGAICIHLQIVLVDLDVDVVIDEIHRPIGGKNLEAHLGILDQKVRQYFCQNELRKTGRTAHSHEADWFRTRDSHLSLGRIEVSKDRAAPVVEGMTDFRETDVPGRSRQQAHTQSSFEIGNAAAHA